MAHLDEILAPGELQPQLRLLLADRTSPEAAAFFHLLMTYVHKRTIAVSRHCGNALAASEQEEVVAEVLLQLMQGSLASFRGQSIPELYGFVRTIADRTTWRVIRRKERERRALEGEGADAVEGWQGRLPRPDAEAERVADGPLSDADQDYLRQLLAAGSKAELARRAGVSRAAVTQRVQRIRKRVAELGPQERSSHEVWLQRAAREALMSQTA